MRPGLIGEHVAYQTKRCARFVRRALAIGHGQALEKVARAAGFPDWHALQTAAKRASETCDALSGANPDQRLELANKQFDLFAKGLPLLVHVRAELPPDENVRAVLEAFSESLSGALDVPPHRARDIVAHMFGSDTWRELCERDPVDAKEPLYIFDPEWGTFNWSDACQALVDAQDAYFQTDAPRSEAEDDACFKQISRMCRRRPDFLEGLLALAFELERRGGVTAAGRCYRDAIRQADALIGTYRGKIAWNSTTNRFYHRLLYGFMGWSAYRGHFKQAVRLARRQLRLNPTDNLGIRYELPVLLTADGQDDAAHRSLTKLRAEEHAGLPHVHLVRSLCLMATAPTDGGVEEFLRALFLFPYLRTLVLDGTYPDTFFSDLSGSRGVIPDCSTIVFLFDILFRSHPMVERVYRAILNDPDVGHAEAQLEASYRAADVGFPDTRELQMQGIVARKRQLEIWRAQLDEAVRNLAQRKGPEWRRWLVM
jgi:tetratricopeptide (TPR) repeat protein